MVECQIFFSWLNFMEKRLKLARLSFDIHLFDLVRNEKPISVTFRPEDSPPVLHRLCIIWYPVFPTALTMDPTGLDLPATSC